MEDEVTYIMHCIEEQDDDAENVGPDIRLVFPIGVVEDKQSVLSAALDEAGLADLEHLYGIKEAEGGGFVIVLKADGSPMYSLEEDTGLVDDEVDEAQHQAMDSLWGDTHDDD